MDNYFKKQLYVWTYDKIKENPEKFGGDFSNSLIMHEYLLCNHSDKKVVQLEPKDMSILSTVSRIKNKLLKKNPDLDYRTKYKPKVEKKAKNHLENFPTKTADR
ncbi:hypothetical protein [Sulfurimonas sp. NWX367]|uniref:hypothetical protein n=1 Tax=Sulfurimonas sp. NWX367 TaxID=2925413 RepID=UPI00320463BE